MPNTLDLCSRPHVVYGSSVHVIERESPKQKSRQEKTDLINKVHRSIIRQQFIQAGSRSAPMTRSGPRRGLKFLGSHSGGYSSSCSLQLWKSSKTRLEPVVDPDRNRDGRPSLFSFILFLAHDSIILDRQKMARAGTYPFRF